MIAKTTKLTKEAFPSESFASLVELRDLRESFRL